MSTTNLFGLELLTLCIVLFLQCAAQEWQVEDSCQNGGESRNGSYPKCSCSRGYKGFDCSQKVSPCEAVPCRNTATCLEKEDGTFTCECSEMYSGLLCEKQALPCDSHPCKNGGNCSGDGLKCFECECPDGYKGSDCSEKISPCFASPCQNDGICSNKKEGGYKCACRKGYGGIICTLMDALYTSYIIGKKVEYIDQLLQWLDGEDDWGLCYRASRDGWGSVDFHSRCDFKGPTVTIIRVGSYIFGGYSNLPWGGRTGYRRSKKTFLFSLLNKDNLKPFKAPIGRYFDNAIYTNPANGPSFGNDNHDLYIQNNAQASAGSYTSFGHSYSPPHGYNDYDASKVLLAGTYKFIPKEVEVFYLQ